jgi:hypothetical protein
MRLGSRQTSAEILFGLEGKMLRHLFFQSLFMLTSVCQVEQSYKETP